MHSFDRRGDAERQLEGQRTGHAPGRRNERDLTVRHQRDELPSAGSEFVVASNGTGGPETVMRIWGDVGPSGTVNVEVATERHTTWRPYRGTDARIDVTGGTVQGEPDSRFRAGASTGDRPWRRRRVQHHLRVGRPDQGDYSMVVRDSTPATRSIQRPRRRSHDRGLQRDRPLSLRPSTTVRGRYGWPRVSRCVVTAPSRRPTSFVRITQTLLRRASVRSR